MVAPGLMALALPVGLRLGPVRMRSMVTEDHLVEWVQVGMLAAAVVLLMRVWRALREAAERRGEARAYFGLALFIVFIALEEISWGQRILGFETPAMFADGNEQGEFNLHNYAWFHVARNWLVLGFAAFGTTAAWCARRTAREGRGPTWIRLLPSGEMLFTLLMCLAIAAWLLYLYLTELRQQGEWRIGRVVAEWAELFVAYVLFLYAYIRHRALGAPVGG